jgi:GNAT superfamily N-acetyltransferase
MVEIDPGAAREAWVELLELADEPAPLRRYVDDGTLYGVVDDASGRPRAAVLTIDQTEGTTELRAVAVAEGEQGTGLGSWLVSEVCTGSRPRDPRRRGNRCRRSGSSPLPAAWSVWSGSSATSSRGEGLSADWSENGIPTRDMAWMDLDLGAA